MTAYQTSTSTSQTLTPASADAVQFTAPWGAFKLTNRGTGTIWFRTDGTVATVGGAGCRPVLPNQFAIWVQWVDGNGASTRNPISLISSAADAYTVEGLNIGSADAAYITTLLANYLPLAGGTMTGAINFGSTITQLRIQDNVLGLYDPAGGPMYYQILGIGDGVEDGPVILMTKQRIATDVLANDVLGVWECQGGQTPAGSRGGKIEFVAGENWSGGARGTGFRLLQNPIGSTVASQMFKVDANGVTQTYGRQKAVVVASTNYSVVAMDEIVLVDSTTGIRTITLPAAATHLGRTITVKKKSADANNITVQATAGNIDNAATHVWATAYASFQYVSDGTNWWII